MFNDNVDLLAEATGYSEALDNSFLEQYTSLDDMVHEMICESYEDMMRLSKFEHDADMMEAKMIVQQESVESISAFQEGIYKKAKNYVLKIVDKLKLKWRKFCIWVNRKVANFLIKRVAGMRQKADKAFDKITGDMPTVKYFTKCNNSAKAAINQIQDVFGKIAGSVTPDASADGDIRHSDVYGKDYYGADGTVKKYKGASLAKEFEEQVLGDFDSMEIKKSMWDIDKEYVKSGIANLLKKGDGSVAKYINTVQKLVKNTRTVAKKDEKERDKNAASTQDHKANVQLAVNNFNTIVSAGSAAMSCFRKVCWAALKAAAKARLSGGSSTSDYEDDDETEKRNKNIISAANASSDRFDDDVDLSVF